MTKVEKTKLEIKYFLKKVWFFIRLTFIVLLVIIPLVVRTLFNIILITEGYLVKVISKKAFIKYNEHIIEKL
jgi:hypothetical protein